MWKTIVAEYQNKPRDVKTVPINNRVGVWFYVFADGNNICVANAKEHEPSCKLSNPRVLVESEFEGMLDLYHRRMNGDKVSKEAQAITYSQVYFYGIFADMKL